MTASRTSVPRSAAHSREFPRTIRAIKPIILVISFKTPNLKERFVNFKAVLVNVMAAFVFGLERSMHNKMHGMGSSRRDAVRSRVPHSFAFFAKGWARLLRAATF